jgi:hypothetical protein
MCDQRKCSNRIVHYDLKRKLKETFVDVNVVDVNDVDVNVDVVNADVDVNVDVNLDVNLDVNVDVNDVDVFKVDQQIHLSGET